VSLHRAVNPAEDCQFCQIVAGRAHAAVVFEDPLSMAFLDSRPLFPGHCLLVPKDHYETLDDLPHELLGPLFSNAQHLAAVVRNAMNAEGTFVAMNNVVSQSVPHFHIHIVPRRKKDGLKGFFWPRRKYESEEEQNAVRDALRLQLKKEKAKRSRAAGEQP
jgi:histidine triad (HIT) family protein